MSIHDIFVIFPGVFDIVHCVFDSVVDETGIVTDM